MFEKTLEIFFEELLKAAPVFFWAGVILISGIAIAKFVERIAKNFLTKLRLNSVLKRIGFEEVFKSIDFELDASNLISQIVKWFFVILFLMASSDVLGFEKFSQFLSQVVNYFPNIFISILIFIIFSFLIDASQKTFIATLEKGKITYSKFIGKGTTLSLWVLAIFAILYQLKIIPELILILFMGVVAVLVLGIGISLGLGGKDLAQKFLREFEEKLK